MIGTGAKLEGRLAEKAPEPHAMRISSIRVWSSTNSIERTCSGRTSGVAVGGM